MAKNPTRRTTRRPASGATQRRTTTGRNGAQVYFRGNSRNERMSTTAATSDIDTGRRLGRPTARRLGRMLGTAFGDAFHDSRATTTSPRPKARPTPLPSQSRRNTRR